MRESYNSLLETRSVFTYLSDRLSPAFTPHRNRDFPSSADRIILTHMKDIIIIGGGIGGCSSAVLMNARGYDVSLFEKESYLGGCASTFSHKKHFYNTGATTVSGYQEGGIVKKLFDISKTSPELIDSNPAMVVLQNGCEIRRGVDFETFLNDLEHVHPHNAHLRFWSLVREITELFYTLNSDHYYSNRSLWDKTVSLLSYFPLVRTFRTHLFTPTEKTLRSFYGEIDQSYRDFLDAQIMIVAQCPLRDTTFFTAAVALGYTFMPTHYPLGGMGALCASLASAVPEVHTSSPVSSIRRYKDRYVVRGSFGEAEARNVIIGSSFHDSVRLFENEDIRQYHERYRSLETDQSAFVLYMRFYPHGNSFHHHYQIIVSEQFRYTLSKSLFVSISDLSDPVLSADGSLSLTASLHTDTRWWTGVKPILYHERKTFLQTLLRETVCATLNLKEEWITECFSATPKTFRRYLDRSRLGGNPLKKTIPFTSLPANDSPIKGLYHVGDTVYPAQGWPGVVMGAMNLLRTFRE